MNDVDGDNELEIYLYSEKFTIYISATNCGGIYGSLDVKLCYFGDMDAPISEYSSQQNLIDFINDFVRYVGYDTKHDENDNHFERLYNECVAGEEKKNSARYAYHFDNLVGELGYYVYLNDSSYTYLYQMPIEDDQKIHANCFIFKGLLKTQDR